MAQRSGKGYRTWLPTGIGGAISSAFGYIAAVPGNLVANQLQGTLNKPYDSVVAWGSFGLSLAVTMAVGFLTVRHVRAIAPRDSEGTAHTSTTHTTVVTANTNSVVVAGEKAQVHGDVVGGDKVIYQSAPLPVTTPTALHQLPTPPADFTGRETELAQLMAAISDKGVTISGLRGMGGIGKTTLALKLAQQLTHQYPDSQLYLDLKGASPQPMSPSEAMGDVIHAYHPEAHLPDEVGQLQSLYRSVLQKQPALLLLDNAADAAQVQPLIPPASCLMLVTSRQRFTLPGVFALDLDTLPPGDARKLLLAIADRLTDQDAGAIAQRCGYLPLALRLAGSALAEHADFKPQDYLRRLQNAQTRLELVDAPLTLSYELLTPELQQRWRALSVFPGSFDVPAAAAVWVLEPDPTHDAVSALRTYSLLEWDTDTNRYRLHDLARLYADSRLERDERATAEGRHAAHFLNVLLQAQALYLKGGGNQRTGLTLFDMEWANIRAGQAWASAHVGDNDATDTLTSRFVGLGVSMLTLRLAPWERVRWLESGLAAARHQGDRAAEATHLSNLGNAYNDLGQARHGIECYQQSLAIAREQSNRRDEGDALERLAYAYATSGQTGQAIQLYEQSLAIAREFGDPWSTAALLTHLGHACVTIGQARQGIKFHQEALAIDRKLGNRQHEAGVLGNLGDAYRILGQAHRAVEFLQQGLAISRELGDRVSESKALANLGLAFDALGDRSQAISSAQAALQILEPLAHTDATTVRRWLAEWRGRERSG